MSGLGELALLVTGTALTEATTIARERWTLSRAAWSDRKAVERAVEKVINWFNVGGASSGSPLTLDPSWRLNYGAQRALVDLFLTDVGIDDLAEQFADDGSSRVLDEHLDAVVERITEALLQYESEPELTPDARKAVSLHVAVLYSIAMDEEFFGAALRDAMARRRSSRLDAELVAALTERAADRDDVIRYLRNLCAWADYVDAGPLEIALAEVYEPARLRAKSGEVVELSEIFKVRDRGGPQEGDIDSSGRAVRHSLIEGGPGAGKSWAARWWMAGVARGTLSKLLAGLRLDQVVVPVGCRCSQLESDPDFYGVLSKMTHSPWPDPARARRLLADDNQALLVVLDALDQSSGAQQVVDHIDTVLRRPNTRTILTSRPEAVPGALRSKFNPDPRHRERRGEAAAFELLPFTQETAERLAMSLSLRQGLREETCSWLLEHVRAANLTNPLDIVLTTFAAAGGDVRDVHQRELREQVLRFWLTHEAERPTRIPRPLRRGQVERRIPRWVDALADLAWRTRTVHQPSSRLMFEDAVRPEVWAAWCRDKELDYDDESILDAVFTKHGLGTGGREFFHSTIQDHLIARHIATLSAEERVDLLASHCCWWRDWERIIPTAVAEVGDHGETVRALIDGPLAGDAAQFVVARSRLLRAIAAVSRPEDWTSDVLGLVRSAVREASTTDLDRLHQPINLMTGRASSTRRPNLSFDVRHWEAELTRTKWADVSVPDLFAAALHSGYDLEDEDGPLRSLCDAIDHRDETVTDVASLGLLLQLAHLPDGWVPIYEDPLASAIVRRIAAHVAGVWSGEFDMTDALVAFVRSPNTNPWLVAASVRGFADLLSGDSRLAVVHALLEQIIKSRGLMHSAFQRMALELITSELAEVAYLDAVHLLDQTPHEVSVGAYGAIASVLTCWAPEDLLESDLRVVADVLAGDTTIICDVLGRLVARRPTSLPLVVVPAVEAIRRPAANHHEMFLIARLLNLIDPVLDRAGLRDDVAMAFERHVSVAVSASDSSRVSVACSALAQAMEGASEGVRENILAQLHSLLGKHVVDSEQPARPERYQDLLASHHQFASLLEALERIGGENAVVDEVPIVVRYAKVQQTAGGETWKTMAEWLAEFVVHRDARSSESICPLLREAVQTPHLLRLASAVAGPITINATNERWTVMAAEFRAVEASARALVEVGDDADRRLVAAALTALIPVSIRVQGQLHAGGSTPFVLATLAEIAGPTEQGAALRALVHAVATTGPKLAAMFRLDDPWAWDEARTISPLVGLLACGADDDARNEAVGILLGAALTSHIETSTFERLWHLVSALLKVLGRSKELEFLLPVATDGTPLAAVRAVALRLRRLPDVDDETDGGAVLDALFALLPQVSQDGASYPAILNAIESWMTPSNEEALISRLMEAALQSTELAGHALKRFGSRLDPSKRMAFAETLTTIFGSNRWPAAAEPFVEELVTWLGPAQSDVALAVLVEQLCRADVDEGIVWAVADVIHFLVETGASSSDIRTRLWTIVGSPSVASVGAIALLLVLEPAGSSQPIRLLMNAVSDLRSGTARRLAALRVAVDVARSPRTSEGLERQLVGAVVALLSDPEVDGAQLTTQTRRELESALAEIGGAEAVSYLREHSPGLVDQALYATSLCSTAGEWSGVLVSLRASCDLLE